MNKIIYMLFLLFSFSFSYNFSDNELNDILNACYTRCQNHYGADSYSPSIRSIKRCYAECEEDYNEGYAEGGSGGIGGGLAGIATKAPKGFIKTPSERDIDMGAGGGSRSAADIMKVVRLRTPGLHRIYNKFLEKKPGFQGKVTLKFTIAPGGEVISISIASSTTGFGEFDGEIKTAVSHWKFSKVKSGNTTVTIPFTFSE